MREIMDSKPQCALVFLFCFVSLQYGVHRSYGQIELGVQQEWDLGQLYGHEGHVGVRAFVNLDDDDDLEVIFNLNRSADFVALDTDGTELWRSTQETANSKEAYYPRISVENGLLFYGSRASNTVYAVNIVDKGPGEEAGSLAWSRQLSGRSSVANMSIELSDVGLIAGHDGTQGRSVLYDFEGNVMPGWPYNGWQHEQLLGAGDLTGDGVDEYFLNPNGGSENGFFEVRNRDGSRLFSGTSQMTHNDYAVIADINVDPTNGNNLGPELLVALDNDGSHLGEGDEIVLLNQLGIEVASFETGAAGVNYAVGDIRPDLPGLEVFFGNEGTNTIGLLDHSLQPIFTSDLAQVAAELGITLDNAAGQTALADLNGNGALELLINTGEDASAGILVFSADELAVAFSDPSFDATDILLDSIFGVGWDFDPQSIFSQANPFSKQFIDVNGDGFDDIIASSVGANSSTGDRRMYLIGNVAAVPEPSSLAMVCAAFLILSHRRRFQTVK